MAPLPKAVQAAPQEEAGLLRCTTLGGASTRDSMWTEPLGIARGLLLSLKARRRAPPLELGSLAVRGERVSLKLASPGISNPRVTC